MNIILVILLIVAMLMIYVAACPTCMVDTGTLQSDPDPLGLSN